MTKMNRIYKLLIALLFVCWLSKESVALAYNPPATVLITTGTMSQYARGKMQEVIRVRQTPGKAYPELPQKLPAVDGYLAMRDPHWIGEVVKVCFEESGVCETFLVVDCAGHSDGGFLWMNRNNIAAEMDYESAVRHNVIGRGTKVSIYRIVEQPLWQ